MRPDMTRDCQALGLAAAHRPAFAAAITCILALTEECFVAHYRLIRVLAAHVFDIGIVIRHADQHACGLPEVLAHATEIIEHVNLLFTDAGPAQLGRPDGVGTQASGMAWNGVSLSVRSLRTQAARPTFSA
ncbi:hypothetical protein D9M68_615960 [compost metagenome]